MVNDIEKIKNLRERTGAGVLECKQALSDTAGDEVKALEILKKKGLEVADKKKERVTSQGLIESYIHSNGRIGVLLEMNCETDFVALTNDFKTCCHDVAMDIAAAAPLALTPEDLDPALIAKEKEVITAQLKQENKPADMIEKIAAGLSLETGICQRS